MEADKLTVFLFLMLVVVMAFSGFVLYDALSGAPVYPKTESGVRTVVGYVSGLSEGPAVTQTTIQYVNGLERGVR